MSATRCTCVLEWRTHLDDPPTVSVVVHDPTCEHPLHQEAS